MSDREKELLAILAEYDTFRGVPMLRHLHPRLQEYSRRQVVWTMGLLADKELVTKTISGPEREVKYKLSDKGRELAASLV